MSQDGCAGRSDPGTGAPEILDTNVLVWFTSDMSFTSPTKGHTVIELQFIVTFRNKQTEIVKVKARTVNTGMAKALKIASQPLGSGFVRAIESIVLDGGWDQNWQAN